MEIHFAHGVSLLLENPSRCFLSCWGAALLNIPASLLGFYHRALFSDIILWGQQQLEMFMHIRGTPEAMLPLPLLELLGVIRWHTLQCHLKARKPLPGL